MSLKQLVSRRTICRISRFNGRLLTQFRDSERELHTVAQFSTFMNPTTYCKDASWPRYRKFPTLSSWNHRSIHSAQEPRLSESEEDTEEDDEVTNEFLSRFVWIMRGKLSEVYPSADKETVDAMLLIIAEKVVDEIEKGGIEKMMLGASSAVPSDDFSEALWKEVWEASAKVLEDMQKEKRKEKMKLFSQDEEVKEMCRFAAEVGIRGDMMREFRYKWAREKMEESEFYESLERMKEEAQMQEKEGKVDGKRADALETDADVGEEKPKVASLPKRQGKFKYKIYGLDLSNTKWAEVADKIHEANETLWPQEPKQISGECKLVTEKILSLKEEEDPSPLLAKWIELLKPSRVDWTVLVDRLKGKNESLYCKVSELLLTEESFQADIRDYSKLIDTYASEDRIEDAERILTKMSENGITRDAIMCTTLVHMYSKAGNLERAKEAFDSLKIHGFKPDTKVYYAMINAYVSAGNPNEGLSLLKEMESRGFTPSEECYMKLIRSFAQLGDVKSAKNTSSLMQFTTGTRPSVESYSLLVEANCRVGDSDSARTVFDEMMKNGLQPDDRCTSYMVSAYERKNYLDKALEFLLELERSGFQFGVNTYSVLLDWFTKLQLVDEAEEMLKKISEQGEVPPAGTHVGLCDMYARAGMEKKVLECLGVLEGKKEQLEFAELQRVADGLAAGGFAKDARRVQEWMKDRGFGSPSLFRTRQVFGRNNRQFMP